jgi:hypothetical protein
MRKLLRRYHEEPNHECKSKPKRAAAVLEAYQRLFQYRRSIAPERVSEIRYVDALRPLDEALGTFIVVGREREALEARDDARTVGARTYPRAIQLTRAALRFAVPLQRLVRTLRKKWEFPSEGRTLRGTVPERGRPKELALGEVEGILHADGSGLSWAEIAALQLDGDASTGATERSRKRVSAFAAFTGSPDPIVTAALLGK